MRNRSGATPVLTAMCRRSRPASALRLVVAAAFVATIPCTTAAPVHASDAPAWLGYHFGPSNNAALIEPGRAPLSWRSPAVSDQILAVSVVGDMVYGVGGGQLHAVYAINRDNGQFVWAKILDNMVMTQPIVANGRVFVGTGNNYMRQEPVRNWATVYRGTGANSLYALDATTGATVWHTPLQGEAMPTPIYDHGMLYWVTGDRRFLAVDAGSGEIVWSLNLPSYMSMSSPVQDGNLVIFGGAHPYAEYAIDITAHRVAWQHTFAPVAGLAVTGAVDDCSPALSAHVVYCTATTSKGAIPQTGSVIGEFAWALDARTGKLLWQADQGAGKLPSLFAAGVPVAMAGSLYVASPGNNHLQALDARTGQQRWNVRLDATGRSAPVVDGRNLFIVDDAGTLYQLDTATGRLVHRMRMGGGVSNLGLVLASGTLYVPNTMGGLVDAIPERTLTTAQGLDVTNPHGPVAAKGGAAACG